MGLCEVPFVQLSESADAHHYRRFSIGISYRHIFNRTLLEHPLPRASLVFQSIAMVELARAVTSSALPSAIATTVKPSSAATSITAPAGPAPAGPAPAVTTSPVTATAVGFRAAVSPQSGRSSVWDSAASTK